MKTTPDPFDKPLNIPQQRQEPQKSTDEGWRPYVRDDGSKPDFVEINNKGELRNRRPVWDLLGLGMPIGATRSRFSSDFKCYGMVYRNSSDAPWVVEFMGEGFICLMPGQYMTSAELNTIRADLKLQAYKQRKGCGVVGVSDE